MTNPPAAATTGTTIFFFFLHGLDAQGFGFPPTLARFGFPSTLASTMNVKIETAADTNNLLIYYFILVVAIQNS